MTKTTLPILIFFLTLLSSCREKRKEELQQSIRDVKNTIGVWKMNLNERGAFIESNRNLSDGKKRAYRYDSLVQVQEEQQGELVKKERELDSLETEYSKLTK